ncbi:recombinase family protein [Parasedimentitalea maritima]|uniref:Recombinase family protein n=1 Tax=Parasedimentitalea maritima TaxID=2578117 RepID=A0ABY2USP5_9RHOB|nr:recombinase family protein [Zongyanglinia marina]TLP60436.1 recombinase family protein [Zongyanglinia marina]
MAKLGYKRVSSEDQSTDRQELPNDISSKNMYEEKVSAGSRTERAELADLLRRIEPGDEIHVYSIDRLARSLTDLTSIVDEMVDKGAAVHFLKENLTFSSDKQDFVGKLMMQVLGAIAEFERNLIRQRQREGIKKAKSAGKYKGKPRTIDRGAVIQLLTAGVSPTQIAKLTKIGIASVYRIRKEQNGISSNKTV